MLIEQGTLSEDGGLLMEIDNFQDCPVDDDGRSEDEEARGSDSIVHYLRLIGADDEAEIDYSVYAASEYICGWE